MYTTLTNVVSHWLPRKCINRVSSSVPHTEEPFTLQVTDSNRKKFFPLYPATHQMDMCPSQPRPAPLPNLLGFQNPPLFQKLGFSLSFTSIQSAAKPIFEMYLTHHWFSLYLLQIVNYLRAGTTSCTHVPHKNLVQYISITMTWVQTFTTSTLPLLFNALGISKYI